MKKNIFSLIVFIIAISFAITSCGKKPETKDTSTKKDTIAKKEEVVKKDDVVKNSVVEGNWVSTDDPKSEIQVKDSDWTEIYSGEKPETFKFGVGDSCLANPNAKTNEKGKYITVFDKDDNRCFYIVNVNDSKLELSYVGRGNTLTYKKKK